MTTFGDILKQAEESGATFAVLENGEYIAKIIESDYQSSSGGKPQIKTRWEVTHGPKAGFKGLWNYFTLTVENPNAMAIFYRQMTALGITSEFMQTLAAASPEVAMKQIASALDGRSAKIRVKEDKEWQNNKIDRISPVPPEFVATGSPSVGSPFPATATSAPPVAPVAPPVTDAPVDATTAQPSAAPVAEATPAPAPAPVPVPLPSAPF